LNYAIDDRQKRFNLNGDVQIAHTDKELDSHTNRTNFLSDGNTYDWIQNQDQQKNTRIATQHNLYLRGNDMDFNISPSFNFHKYKNWMNHSSATFTNELTGFTKEQLDIR